jgi:hypothetical protein
MKILLSISVALNLLLSYELWQFYLFIRTMIAVG